MITPPPQSDQNQDFPAAGRPASPFSIKEVWTLTQGKWSFGAGATIFWVCRLYNKIAIPDPHPRFPG